MKWNPGGWLRDAAVGLDQSIAEAAAARARSNKAAGYMRNRDFLRTQPADVVAARLMDEAAASGLLETPHVRGLKDLTDLLGGLDAHQVARTVIPGMSRGPMGIGQMGVMEAINTGIATNPYVRRGALPTAIVGGGALATGAVLPAVTSAGQGLMQLMGFMQQGQQTAQAREESPLLSG